MAYSQRSGSPMAIYAQAAKAIKSYQGTANFLGKPANDTAISEAESILSVQFSDSYRQYLRDFG